jgi:multiple sugar transport system permease protein
MSSFNNKNNGIINYMDLKKPSVKVLYAFFLAFFILLTIISLVPPLWVMLSSLKNIKEFFTVPATIIPRTFEPQKIVDTWNKLNFARYYMNSLTLVAGAVVCAVLFNGLVGYVLSILKPKGSKFVMVLVLWSLMLPATTNLVPVFKNITSLHMNNHFLPLWLAYGAGAFNVMLFKSFFDALPFSLIEAARLDGCSDLGIFSRVVLPLSKAVCMVVIIMTINAAWSDFLLPYLVLRDQSKYTVIVKINDLANGSTPFPYDMRLLALLFAIVPPAILFTFFQKYITQGIALSGIKG